MGREALGAPAGDGGGEESGTGEVTRLRVALIRSSVHRRGGAERYAYHLARGLAERGHEVHLYARRCEELPHPRVVLHRVPTLGGLSFLKVLSFAWAVRRMLAGEHYDVVHALDRVLDMDIYRAGDGLHREWLSVSARYLPAWRRHLRLLNPLHWAVLWLEGRIFRGGARVVVAISKKGVDEISRHFGFPAEVVPCIYNGVDLEEFSPALRAHRREVRGRLGVGEGARVVLFVGTGYFRKGLHQLIEAIGLLAERGRPVRLVVAGRSHSLPYRRLAARCGAGKALLFAPPDIPTSWLYGAADAFCLPALYEPFGNVCLEALAVGLPAIFSSRSGGAEILSDGEDGLILRDPSDPFELSRLLERALDPEEGARLGAKARCLAERFTLGANVEATESLYRSVRRTGVLALGEGR